MPNRSPHGNLTATLAIVALLELVIDRLLGRLFLSPGCHSGVGCLLLRSGPFVLHLTGALTLVVATGGIVGHLRRGELFPRGMRLTIAALSAIFLFLVALSLAFGRIPDRYHIHLETSFGFVVGLLVLSFLGSDGAPRRVRFGFVLFALPALLHIAALVSARAGWLSQGPVTPERLTALGELLLLLAALASPFLLLPRHAPRGRIGAGVALAAGITTFFFVAFLGRTDLVQTIVLYSVQLELPRPLSALGVTYALSLFAFVTAAAVLLFSPGAGRLTGLGMCLVGLAGYQTSSPVALGLAFCGFLALATGLVRAGRPGGADGALLSATEWRSFLGAVAAAIADPAVAATEPVLIEVSTGDGPGGGGGGDTGTVRVRRRGQPIVLKLVRLRAVVRQIDATVGTPESRPPDAIIESHEAWLGRRAEDRVPLPRMKTGDAAFDRKLSVHGRAPMRSPELRRKVARLSDGSVSLWTAQAARFVAPEHPGDILRRYALPVGMGAVRSTVALVDALVDLLEASAESQPSDAAE